jgi:hypothetical protein
VRGAGRRHREMVDSGAHGPAENSEGCDTPRTLEHVFECGRLGAASLPY